MVSGTFGGGNADSYSGTFVNGQLVLTVAENDSYGSTVITRNINAKVILDAIAKLGTVEASLVAMVEAAILPPASAAPPVAPVA